MTTIARAKQTASRLERALRRARRRVWANRRFLRQERRSPVRWTGPDLLLRGYQSDRRWLYPTRPSRGAGYVADVTYWRRAAGINPASVQEVFGNKTEFDRVMRAHGLGDVVPQLLATVEDGEVNVLQEWDGPVAFKLADGSSGKGFSIFPSLAEALAQAPASGSHLVQEQVVAHPFGAELFPGSLNTMRVLALRDGPGEPVRFPAVIQKIGRTSGAPLDSFDRGGLLARVDPVTGTLGPGLGPVVGRSRDTWDVHPDSGAQITGRTVPLFDDVLRLATRVMEAFPEALHVGWDIALSERGPLIIEGNAGRPSLRLLQAHGPFADDPSVRPRYEQWGLLPKRRTPRSG